MQQVHEGAYDFTRFTELGHRWLFRRFETISRGALVDLACHSTGRRNIFRTWPYQEPVAW
ncbi:hypothetical protein MES5069_620012 [Mesorhizobium escarrei]|uniref:Uncharacterized protein n=1 Tax=Mesorhizobium escarrei TaxID=666018 RepID=A0ABN8KET9_9HYPH|nr:hypothetical protein MES5069_620012 [Mesorhizobium escarrei]